MTQTLLPQPLMHISFEIWGREHDFAEDSEAWELVDDAETIDEARRKKERLEAEDPTSDFSLVRSIDIREEIK